MGDIIITGHPDKMADIEHIERIAKLRSMGRNVIVIEDKSQDPKYHYNVIDVDGKKYKPVEEDKPLRSGKSMSKVMLMAAVFGWAEGDFGSGSKKERPEVDIVEEFKLIQKKKSQLSKSNRDWVEFQFHSMYNEIKL